MQRMRSKTSSRWLGREGRIQGDPRRCWGVEVRTCDNGVGIAPEIQSCIFDPLLPPRKSGALTGQRLTIVYGIVVNRHGGEILLRAGARSGTTFIVRLRSIDTRTKAKTHRFPSAQSCPRVGPNCDVKGLPAEGMEIETVTQEARMRTQFVER